MNATDKLLELGRRAIACPDWAWMPGMLARSVDTPARSYRVLRVQDNGRVHCDGGYQFGGTMRSKDSIPAFNDPATIGCMMYLVRAALNDPSICWVPDIGQRGGWGIASRLRSSDESLSAVRLGDTLADALVVALESFERADE